MEKEKPVQLRRALGLFGLVLFGLSYMAVTTVFTTYGIVNQITNGRLPLAYVVALITMLFTALSYAAMVKKFPVAGSAYTYVQQSFGGVAGFLTGWLLLLDYLFIPMLNFLILGLYVNSQFPSIPMQIPAFMAVALVYLFNVFGIKLANRFNIATVAISAAVVAAFAILALKMAIADPNAPSLLAPFIPGAEGFSPILTGAGILALSFLGFDAVSTLSEEARRPGRDIPRAIIMTTLIGGGIFILVAWIGSVAYRPESWANVPQELLDSAGVVLANHVGGSVFGVVMVIATIAGCLGSGLTGQVSVSRILYSMGRDGILPRRFGTLSQRYKTPVFATTVISAIALLCLVLSLDQVAYMISFGALAAFTMVNLSIIRVYLFSRESTPTPSVWLVIRYGLVPAVGVALSIWLWTSLQPFTWIIGGIWAAIGVLIMALKTNFFRKPVPTMDFVEADVIQGEHVATPSQG